MIEPQLPEDGPIAESVLGFGIMPAFATKLQHAGGDVDFAEHQKGSSRCASLQATHIANKLLSQFSKTSGTQAWR